MTIVQSTPVSSRRIIRLGLCGTALAALFLAGQVFGAPAPVLHWERTSAEISPPVINSMGSALNGDLSYVVAAWNTSPVIQSALVTRAAPGDSCHPIQGAIRFCVQTGRPNFPAGTQVFYKADGHLQAVRAFVSDEFIGSPPFDNSVGRHAAFCYLLGVAYGATPQDLDPFNEDITDASGQQSCLDATPTPEGNENPTPVDFAAIAELYAHSHTNFAIRDLSKSNRGSNDSELSVPSDLLTNFGSVVGRDAKGRAVTYVRHLPGGGKVLTSVYWGG